MREEHRHRRSVLLLCRAAFVAWAVLQGESFPLFGKAATKIVPGSTTISEEEKTLGPDPSIGAEQGVILLQEVERNQDLAAQDQLAVHLRAKILTNEGRDLANVSIPIGDNRNELIEWWGRTLLPDGKVLELPRDQLKEQTVARTALRESRELKGALPGVVPGAVIDFGYVIRHGQNLRTVRVPLQMDWLIKEWRYVWTPAQGRGSAYVMTLAEKLDVKAEKQGRSFVFTGRNLPSVASEPMMPPDDEARAAVTFYYTFYGKDAKFYWPDAARNVEEHILRFITKDQPAFARTQSLRETIAGMDLPKDADLPTRLRTVYEWIGSNIENLAQRTSEEEEAAAAVKKKDYEENSALEVLDRKHGTPYQMDLLFTGLARELGAKAYLIYASDRTEHYFNASLISDDQFDDTLVAVFLPGADKYTLVDPGSGLPYGEIPWWLAGSKGLLLTEEGAKSIMLWPSEAKSNVSDTRTTLEFEDENSSVKSTWTRTATGQQWFLDRRVLRRLQPDPRKKRLEGICGKAGDVEVRRAEVPDLGKPGAAFKITCEASRPETLIDSETSDYRASFAGAWVEALPELTATKRTHPVIFTFPRVDLNTIEVRSPKDFTPGEAPAPVKIESRFGRYELSIERTDRGFHVSRKLALLPLRVPPEEYDDLVKFLSGAARTDKTMLPFHRAAPEHSRLLPHGRSGVLPDEGMGPFLATNAFQVHAQRSVIGGLIEDSLATAGRSS